MLWAVVTPLASLVAFPAGRRHAERARLTGLAAERAIGRGGLYAGALPSMGTMGVLHRIEDDLHTFGEDGDLFGLFEAALMQRLWAEDAMDAVDVLVGRASAQHTPSQGSLQAVFSHFADVGANPQAPPPRPTPLVKRDGRRVRCLVSLAILDEPFVPDVDARAPERERAHVSDSPVRQRAWTGEQRAEIRVVNHAAGSSASTPGT